MMKAIIKVKKEVDIKTLEVKAFIRYWEDAVVDGVEDADGVLIPCRSGDYWTPRIAFDSGRILNWKKGVTASIHYKVCDEGSYYLKDSGGETVLSEDYVPEALCPKSAGYGDYIIMDVEADGQIKDWKPTLSGFLDEED